MIRQRKKLFLVLIKVDKGKVDKLDQVTWLYRTHSDDFWIKIWTILDHTRPRLHLVIKAILFNLWSIFFRPFRIIWKHWRPRGCILFFCSYRLGDIFCPKRLCDFFLSKEIAWFFLSQEVAWFLLVQRGFMSFFLSWEVASSQVPNFPISQVPKFPSSRIPKFPSSQVPQFPCSQFPMFKSSQVLWFPSSLVLKFISS